LPLRRRRRVRAELLRRAMRLCCAAQKHYLSVAELR
jgi:hypothetical protein